MTGVNKFGFLEATARLTRRKGEPRRHAAASDGRRYVQADLVDGTSLRIGQRQVFSGEAIAGRTLNRLDHPEP